MGKRKTPEWWTLPILQEHIAPTFYEDANRWYYTFKCHCGMLFETQIKSVNAGLVKSCGCLRGIINTTHGMSNTKTYHVWNNMIRRCEDENNKDYHNYGERGIEVCTEWYDFENFLKDMEECPEGMTLGRKNNDGDYCKENCEWQSLEIQSLNKQNTVYLTDKNGITKPLVIWAKELGILPNMLYARKYRGLSDLEILDL